MRYLFVDISIDQLIFINEMIFYKNVIITTNIENFNIF